MLDVNKNLFTDYTYKVSAAGRINLIGEHVDYCGGRVFPAALSLKNTVYVRPNGMNRINLKWTTLKDCVSLDIDKLSEYKSLRYGNYQAGCAYMLKLLGYNLVGCDILSDCTVPFGSGLSSSAAIEVSTIGALLAVSQQEMSNLDIALLAQKVERDYAFVNCGIMDQFASCCGRSGMAMHLDCKTLECEYVPFDLGEFSLIITNSNKLHNLVESKYNERRAEADFALKVLATRCNISCLAELTFNQLKDNAALLPPTVYKRVLHIVSECARVELAVRALKAGDIASLGSLINQSHWSLSELYEVTGFEMDALARAGQSHGACVGSRMIGGGFGGCAISLVKKGAEDDFKKHVSKEYFNAVGYVPAFYDAEIADGLTIKKIEL